MGTDIHVYLEEKHKDGKWHCVGKNMYDGRDYNLFGLLAGVRCYGINNAVTPLRGLPKDVSDVIRKAWVEEREWSHSCTWYALDELFDALYKKNVSDCKDDADSLECFLQSIINYMVKDMSWFQFQVWKFRRQFPKIAERFRVVMWFDS